MGGSVILTTKQFQSLCFERTKFSFVTNWNADFREKPLLRSYRLYKTECSYLDCINLPKYRIPVSKIRASSHDFEIEPGRYTRPRLIPNQRLCSTCLEVEDEEHFATSCRVNINERQSLFTKIISKDPTFMHLDNREKFTFLMSCKDRQILTWFGKFLHKSFITRNMKTNRSCIPPQHAGTSWWSTENFCVYWLTMLIFCFTSLVYTCIDKVGCLVICIYVCTYRDRYIYACAYIHIINGDGFYEHFMISFTIYSLHNITGECLYHIMRCYCMMLNFKCTVSYFTVLPCMLILP